MGFLRGAILGAGVGAGVGYYNADPGREWRGAAAGAMIGATAGGAGQKLGGMAMKGAGGIIGKGAGGAKGMYGRTRSSFAQMRGRNAWKGNTRQFGPIQENTVQFGPKAPGKPRLMANRAMGGIRQAVATAKGGIKKGMTNAKAAMVRPEQAAMNMGRNAKGQYLSPNIPMHGVRNAKGQFNPRSKIGKMQGRGYEGGGTLTDQAMNFKPSAEQSAWAESVGAFV